VYKKYFISALVAAFFCFLSVQLPAQNAAEVVDKMLSAISRIKTISYTTRVQERIDGKQDPGTNQVKLNVKPFKVYVKVSSAEVLFVEGKNNNKALVKSNSLPYINLSLDPMGSTLRKSQHHTLYEVGFSYFGNIIQDAVKKAGDDFENIFTLKGTIKWEDRDCFVILLENKDFKFIPYVVQPGEDLVSIARTRHLSEYMILERNREVKDYYSVKPGQEILIPTSYAYKTIVYVDKQHFLPVVQIVFDDRGIFERYEFTNIRLNPQFAPDEFNKDFKGYGFR
jgi:outer membrane lipoprotein-sorting protein